MSRSRSSESSVISMRRDKATAGEHTILVAPGVPPFQLVEWLARPAAALASARDRFFRSGPGRCSRLSCSGSGRFSSLEALPAEDRPSLSGPERHCGFPATLRTHSGGFDPPRTCGPLASILPSRLAVATTLRLVFEIFLMVELLFARGENEFGSAVHALQHPILKFRHYRPS